MLKNLQFVLLLIFDDPTLGTYAIYNNLWF